MKLLLAVTVLGIAAGVLLTPAAALADFGIDPGKVFIDNLYPGAEADVPITIYNQNDYTTNFLISTRNPDYTENGYEPFPHTDWISIIPEQVTIDANQTADVLIVIIMPEDAQYSGKKAEGWISFKEQGEPGSSEMIQIEIVSRLLISTRVEAEIKPTVPSTSTIEPAEEIEPAQSEVITGQPTQKTEPTKLKDVPVQPTLEGGAEVGITAELGETETVSPEVEPGFPWLVGGPVLGLITVIGIIFILRWARQRT